MGRPRKHPRKWYVATDTGVADFDGVPEFFRKDVTRVPEGHRLLASCPRSFKLVDGDFPEIEQLTVGEKRGDAS